ncbi:MAG: histidine kinase [Cyclobacteriaceae bacterium]
MRQLKFLIAFISCIQLSAQHSELDGLRKLYNTDGTSDSLKCAYFGEMGYYHAFRNYDSSRWYLDKAIECSQNLEISSLQNRYFNFLGMAFAVNGKLDSSVLAFKNAYQIAKDAHLDSASAQSLYGLGNVYHSIGNMPQALEYFLKALKFFEIIRDSKSAHSCKANISEIYLSLKEYKKAMPLVRETNAYYLKNNIRTGKRNGYNRLGLIFKAEGETDSAFYYLRLARKLAIEHNEVPQLARIEVTIGDLYFDNAQFKNAIKYYRDGLANYESVKGDPEEILVVVSNLAYCYAVLKDFSKVQIFQSRAEKLAEKSESIEFKINFYENSYKIDSILGNPSIALLSFQRLTALNQLLLNQEKSKQLTEMETKYETEKKEAEIASLSQQASIQQLQIQQKNQTMLIGVVVFLLLAAVIYFIYREKNLRNQRSQTELEQRFLRSQLNPHFIFNALLAIQNFMLKNDGPKAALYLTKFSKLMREILESSRQEFIPLESEVELITNYLDIHKMRLNDAFNYSIEIDDQIDPETDTIPPMFVQPFVENAIEHGMADKKEGGLIEIKFQKSENHISIKILDNGKGLISTESKNHKSLASTIIRERMALFNKTLKNKIQLVLDNIQHENGEIAGTKVELKVPFSYL